MPDTKVSDFTDGVTANATDRLGGARSPFATDADSVYITPVYLDTYMASTTQTLTNKTLGATTLSGTISGGGQQINNVIIGTSTPLAGTFTIGTFTNISAATGTITTSAPMNFTQTWNAAGVTFRGKENVFTMTASATASTVERWLGGAAGATVLALIDKVGNISTGGYITPSIGVVGGGHASMKQSGDTTAIDFFINNGSTPASVYVASVVSASNGRIGFASVATGGSTSTLDTILVRDAANTLALRNGTTGQVLRIYHDTDAGITNYARAFIDAGVTTANTLIFGSEKGGTPTAAMTKFRLQVDGALVYDYNITLTGSTTLAGLVAMGVSHLFNSSSGFLQAYSGGGYTWTSGSHNGTVDLRLTRLAAGVLVIDNNAAGFGSLLLGPSGTTFNRIKHDATGVLAVKLADDSAYSTIRALSHDSTGSTVAALPAAGTAGRRRHVTDSNAASFTAGIGAVVAGGGATIVPVFDDGTNWRIG